MNDTLTIEYSELKYSQIWRNTVDEINHLLRQVSSSAPPLTVDDILTILDRGARLFVARHNRTMVGMVTLIPMVCLSGTRNWIEDVVTDDEYRGHGIGEQLMRMAIAASEQSGAKSLDLTSRPSREPAWRLYLRVGFQERQTGVFRLEHQRD
jgi:ribosomal protein S18 acetylase RimI-like enzyme